MAMSRFAKLSILGHGCRSNKNRSDCGIIGADDVICQDGLGLIIYDKFSQSIKPEFSHKSFLLLATTFFIFC